MKKQREIRGYYETLWHAWGPQHWWPADSAFEVIVGAILTQNTAWTNVEKALANLRRAKALSIKAIREIRPGILEKLVQPAGYFRQKAARMKTFVAWLDERYHGSLAKMFAQSTQALRSELLAINGIGPETADSILLYAGQHETFVVDAYTRRVLERHGMVEPGAKYDGVRMLIEEALQEPGGRALETAAPVPAPVEGGPGPAEETSMPTVHRPSRMSEAPRSQLAQRYNEFHGLIVQVGKHYCQSRIARCESCPLRGYLSRPVFPKPKTTKRKTGY